MWLPRSLFRIGLWSNRSCRCHSLTFFLAPSCQPACLPACLRAACLGEHCAVVVLLPKRPAIPRLPSSSPPQQRNTFSQQTTDSDWARIRFALASLPLTHWPACLPATTESPTRPRL